MRCIPTLLIALAACGDDSSPASDTTTPGTFAPDTGAPDTTAPETVSDAGVTSVPDALEDAVAPEPDTADPEAPLEPSSEEAPLAIDWAIQSDHGAGITFGFPTVRPLADGGVAVVSYFNGTIAFGDHAITGNDDTRQSRLFTRVTPDGEVAALTWMCERCTQGVTPIVELSDGRLAFASYVDGPIVVRPGAPDDATFEASRELLVAIVDRDGRVERWSRIAHLPNHGEATALALMPDGGLLIGGHAMAITVDGLVDFRAEEDGWHYPGRGWIIGLDADLRPRFADVIGGQAGCAIGLLHADENGFFVVGDFGGYPLGVSSIFSVGTPNAIELASVSSDDDPAMDIFVARWALPVDDTASSTRPTLQWVRRIAHYSNGPRPPTWIRQTDDPGEVELRIDGATALEPDDDGQLIATRPGTSWGTLVVRATRQGAFSAGLHASADLLPAHGGELLGVAGMWAGGQWSADDGPTFTIPEETSGEDGISWSGQIYERRREDGALLGSGLLLQRVSSSRYPLPPHGVVPQPDGSFLVVLHGSASVTLIPSFGDPVELTRDGGYERLVVLRARLVLDGE